MVMFLFCFQRKGSLIDFASGALMKVGGDGNVVAFCVDGLFPVVSVLPVVYGGSVVITGIAPNVSAGFRKPRKRERSYFAA